MAGAQIAESLRQHARPVGDLNTHPENPRRGDIGVIAGSLKRFGQVRPIIVQPDGTILAGNHTYRAATELLGWDEIAAVVVDLPPAEARAFLLADNRTSDLGSYDDEVLATMLSQLLDDGQLQGTGYDPDGVEDLLAQIGQVSETEVEEFQGDYAESPEETAQRWNVPPDGERPQVQPMREVVLMLKQDEFEEFGRDVGVLKGAWSMDSTTATICRAVKEASQAANEADVPG